MKIAATPKVDDMYIDVTYRNKNAVTVSAESVLAISGTDVQVILPSGVSDLSGYDAVGMVAIGFASDKKAVLHTARYDVPYLQIFNPLSTAVTINAGYAYYIMRYKKK